MNFKQVIETEKQFAKTGADGTFTLSEPQIIPLAKESNLALRLTKCTRVKEKNPYFFKEQFDKKQIVLHFTTGHLKGDILSLTGEDSDPKRRYVSVPYVIGRNGTIYRLFSSEFWAYHIGANPVGPNKELSRTRIAIELSNYGSLTLAPDKKSLLTYYNTPTRKDIYCNLEDKQEYIKLKKPFRGYTYYTAFTEAQYDSLIVLLRYLTTAWGIKRAFLSEALRFETTEKALDFDGIVSHINYRKDKYDIGTAFNWKKVMDGVLAIKYESKQHKNLVKKGLESRSRPLIERDLDDPSWYDNNPILSDSIPEPIV